MFWPKLPVPKMLPEIRYLRRGIVLNVEQGMAIMPSAWEGTYHTWDYVGSSIKLSCTRTTPMAQNLGVAYHLVHTACMQITVLQTLLATLAWILDVMLLRHDLDTRMISLARYSSGTFVA
jgi:hypothetical protein